MAKEIGEEVSGPILGEDILDFGEKSNLKAAFKLLQAVIDEVNTMCRSGRIQQMQADALIGQAELAISSNNPGYAAF